MRIKDVQLTATQIAAGEAAMTGTFRCGAVAGALIRAGVTNENWTADEAANRLLQRARKAGRIRAVTNKKWISL